MGKLTWSSLVILVLLLFTLPIMVGCDGDDEKEPSSTATQPTGTAEPVEDVVITIGHHVDLTGPGANPMAAIVIALDDMVEYYNSENLIPGVKLKVETYDNQYDPAKDIPGYEWLKEKGADVILSAAPVTATTLETRLAEDQMVLFGLAPDEEALDPPGYVFAGSNSLAKYGSWTLLKWVAENDPDFPKDRSATLGGASWTEGHSSAFFAGAEEYADSHPDQYDWVDGFLTNYTFVWPTEVEALKDLDYVIPPTMITNFAREYGIAGGKAKFIGDQHHLAFLGLVDDADLWDEIDGMQIVTNTRWWNEEGPIVGLAKELLYRYHSEDEAESIIKSGTGYMALSSIFVMLEIIKDTVEAVGPENFDYQALYEAAQSFSFTMDDLEFYTFSETKRAPQDYFGMYEIRAAEKNVFRVVPEWLPAVTEP